MYNIETDSVYGAAGMNVVWTADGWNPMGPIIDLTPYLTKTEAEKLFQPKGEYLTAAEEYLNRQRKVKMEFLTYMQMHWVEWLFTIITTLIGVGYRGISKRLKEKQRKNAAIAEGVQSLLRENIVGNYNKYKDRKHCPIYAKESIKKVYSAYHNLGGNDVATELYHKLLAMPEEQESEE